VAERLKVSVDRAVSRGKLTREELTELFKPYDPEHVHEHIEPDEMAKILGVWKPRYIHSERSKKLVRAVIEEAGFAAEETHYDLPKPRTSFPQGHLNSGVAFAFPWHRDTWYSAPAQQLNWWLPIYPIASESSTAFHPRYWSEPVKNGSREFNYYEWNSVGRASAAHRRAHRDHGRLVQLALAGRGGAVDGDLVERHAQGLHRRAVGDVIPPAPDPAGGGERRGLGDADQFERKVAVRDLAGGGAGGVHGVSSGQPSPVGGDHNTGGQGFGDRHGPGRPRS